MASINRWMTKKMVTCSPDKPILHAAKLMKKHTIGTVVVLSNKKVVGIITERDILNYLSKSSCDLANSIDTIMTKKPVSMQSGDPDTKAAYIMRKNKIKKIIVLKNEKLAGIVTQTDLLKSFSKYWTR